MSVWTWRLSFDVRVHRRRRLARCSCGTLAIANFVQTTDYLPHRFAMLELAVNGRDPPVRQDTNFQVEPYRNHSASRYPLYPDDTIQLEGTINKVNYLWSFSGWAEILRRSIIASFGWYVLHNGTHAKCTLGSSC